MDSKTQDEFFMRRCLELAAKAAANGEVPVGAVIVFDGNIIAEGSNLRETRKSPIAHAELLAIEQAASYLGRWRLTGCTLYVSLEPCTMCAGAIVLARLDQVIFGTQDPKAGAVGSLYDVLSDSRLNHQPRVKAGVLAHEASQQLSQFFGRRREEKKNRAK